MPSPAGRHRGTLHDAASSRRRRTAKCHVDLRGPDSITELEAENTATSTTTTGHRGAVIRGKWRYERLGGHSVAVGGKLTTESSASESRCATSSVARYRRRKDLAVRCSAAR